MPELPFLHSDPTLVKPWVVPVVGLLGALLALLTGRFVLARWRAAPGAPTEDADHDPFDKGSLTERRASRRRDGNPIEVLMNTSDPTAEPVRGWVIDRSMGGACLLLHEAVAPGTVLRIKPRKGPFGAQWIDAEVRVCKKVRSGYEVGCRFVKAPPFGVLLLLG